MGVATVGLLHRLVRRTTGSPAAGLIAGATMALTPVAVLMFRFNNPDAMLTLLMVGAAGATLKAVDSSGREDGHPVRWLSLGGALVGSRLPDQDAAGVPRAAGAGARLPAVRADLVGQAPRPPAGGVRHDAARGWLVDRDRRAVAGLEPSLHRRLAEQLDPRAHPRLQRPRPAQRQRDRLRRRWRRRWRRQLGRDRALPPVQHRDRRPDRVAAPGSPRPRRGRALVRTSPEPPARRAHPVADLAAGDRADLQLHGRHLPRVLHGRPRPGHRRARRHRRLGAVAAPHVVRRDRSARVHHGAHRRCSGSTSSTAPTGSSPG